MGACIVVPVGVTRETVEKFVVKSEVGGVDCVLAVIVPGLEEDKEPIMRGLEYYAGMVGARFHRLTLEPGDPGAARRVYEVLAGEEPESVVMVGVTGSRYLYPLLFMALLYYWRRRGIPVYLLHGVEGGEAALEPLAGFFAPAMRVTRVQKRILRMVYGLGETLSGKDLIERYGFKRSVYAVLSDLERKGLLRVRRGRIEPTLPGALYYSLLEAGED